MIATPLTIVSHSESSHSGPVNNYVVQVARMVLPGGIEQSFVEIKVFIKGMVNNQVLVNFCGIFRHVAALAERSTSGTASKALVHSVLQNTLKHGTISPMEQVNLIDIAVQWGRQLARGVRQLLTNLQVLEIFPRNHFQIGSY